MFIAGYQLQTIVQIVVIDAFDDHVQLIYSMWYWGFTVLSTFLALEAMLVSL